MAKVILFKPVVKATAAAKGVQVVSRVARQEELSSKARAPKSFTHSSGSGAPKPGRRLSQDIHRTPTKITTASVTQRVGSSKSYAASVHEGSKRHRIPGAGGSKTLMFNWTKGYFKIRRGRKARLGGTFFFKSVHHPGQRHATRYLTQPLKLIARINKFKYRENPGGLRR